MRIHLPRALRQAQKIRSSFARDDTISITADYLFPWRYATISISTIRVTAKSLPISVLTDKRRRDYNFRFALLSPEEGEEGRMDYIVPIGDFVERYSTGIFAASERTYFRLFRKKTDHNRPAFESRIASRSRRRSFAYRRDNTRGDYDDIVDAQLETGCKIK